MHFPWCIKKCPYCDFLSLAIDPKEIPHEAYAERVVSELRVRARDVSGRRLRSVFIGGGTPSLWEPTAIARLLDALRQQFQVVSGPEISVECNPSSFNLERAKALLGAGVTRVSIGVQSLDPERLQFLGRWHTPTEALAAVEAALASGMERVSADLIYGVHSQSPEQAAREVERLAATGVTHLSAYTLTIEKGTVFGARAEKGQLPLLGDDTVADCFVAVHDALEALGFEHYEISNFARHQHYAQHNLGYWRGEDYLGLGAGAWGTLRLPQGRFRYRNTPSPERYLDIRREFASLEDERRTGLVQQLETIDAETALRERLLLGLRLNQGLDLSAAGLELGVEPWTQQRVRSAERLVQQGRLLRKDGRLSIPTSQWLFADGTIAALL